MWSYTEKKDLIACYVDDIIAVGITQNLEDILKHLRKYAEVKDFGDLTTYLAIDVARNR